MVTFNLVYSDDALGSARRIEFEAADAHGALRIAQSQAVGRTAELWEGERKLCTLKRVGPEGTIWEVGPGSDSTELASANT
jgi:hypothetical protein